MLVKRPYEASIGYGYGVNMLVNVGCGMWDVKCEM